MSSQSATSRNTDTKQNGKLAVQSGPLNFHYVLHFLPRLRNPAIKSATASGKLCWKVAKFCRLVECTCRRNLAQSSVRSL